MPLAFEQVDQQREHACLVIHDEDPQGTQWRQGARRILVIGSAAPLDDGKADHEGRASPRLPFDLDRAAVLFDDTFGDGQPETGPLLLALGREERLEYALAESDGNAGAVVGDAQPKP